MSVHIAWIGTAHIHTPGFTNEVVKRGLGCAGVYDHNADRAAMNAEKLGGPVRSLEELVADPSVSGYVVCSETLHHLDLAKALTPTQKPIFLEKPMGFNGEQSESILALFEEHQATFQTGYFSRGGAAIRTLRKLVQEGFFGQITRVRASNCHSGALGGWFDTDWRWMADRSQAGVGAFGDLGTHVLDLLIWMFGGITSVTATMDPGTNRYPGCEETGEALLRFSNGTIGTLTAAWDDVTDPARLMISGTKGYAVLGSDLKIAGPDGKLESYEPTEPAVSAGFGAFLDHLEGKSVELVTAREAANRDVVMDAIYQAAQYGIWVEIDSKWH